MLPANPRINSPNPRPDQFVFTIAMNPVQLNSHVIVLRPKPSWLGLLLAIRSSGGSGLAKSALVYWGSMLVVLLGLMMAPLTSRAQLRVEVTGLGVTLIPLNMNGFRDETSASQKISAIVQADLERAGQFKLTTTALSMDETSRPDFSVLRERAMENFVSGSVTKLADGRYDVRFRLWDLMKSQDLGGASYAVSSLSLIHISEPTRPY